MDKDYDALFRIMILGDTGVGKTCLLQRFCDEEFRHSHIYTIGIDFKMKTVLVDDLKVRIQIWDTAGQERYRTITRQYYRKAQGMILAYDITNEKSFLNVRNWASDATEYGNELVQTILVGNKSDREDSRVVSYEQGKALAEEYGLLFFESSAYTDNNVTELFLGIAKKVLEVYQDEIQTADDALSSDGGEEMSEADLIRSDDGTNSISLTENKEGPKKSDRSCCSIL